jgi:hypothetical protein
MRAGARSSRFIEVKPAPYVRSEFPFDPLGFARLEKGLKLHPAALVAVAASTFPADASADALDFPLTAYNDAMSQTLKDQQELCLLTVIALLCFSAESLVLLAAWRDMRQSIHPERGDEWIHNAFHAQLNDTRCFPIDMECDVCERNEAFSAYYGEEIWLCVND